MIGGAPVRYCSGSKSMYRRVGSSIVAGLSVRQSKINDAPRCDTLAT
jgi:hypothetical protein